MSNLLKEGDIVKVKDREQTSADIKSQLFYDHYRNLVGKITKIFADNTATVMIESDALPRDIANRNVSNSEGIRQKWLDTLSEEAKNRLSAAEKKVSLRYSMLIHVSDLEIATAADMKPNNKSASAKQPVEEPRRKTLDELEAEEAKHFEEITKNKN